MPKEIKTYAKVEWTAPDIKTLRPKWSMATCEEFLKENERFIKDRMVELGWEVIENLLPIKRR